MGAAHAARHEICLHVEAMNPDRRRVFLFLACAAVLVAGGFAWGSSHAYNEFYSPESSLDREMVHLDFNRRVLHHANQGDAGECRRQLAARLRQQVAFANGMLTGAPATLRHEAEPKLREAQQALAGQPAVAVQR